MDNAFLINYYTMLYASSAFSRALLTTPFIHSLCTDVPPPSGKIGRGDVCESPLLIVFQYTFAQIFYFVFSPTVEKVHVGQKIALASVHRLAEHLYAMSTQKSIYNISDYNQARSRSINVFIIRKLNRW